MTTKAQADKARIASKKAEALEEAEELMRTIEAEAEAAKTEAQEAIDQAALVHAKPAKSGAKPAAPAKATQPGHTLCRVTGTPIRYNGKVIPEGTVAEFDDATVLEMPAVLVSVE